MEFIIFLFESLGLYSADGGLGDHLRGLDLNCTDYSQQSLYNNIFLWLFIVNTVIMVNYYYLLFNRRPWNRWWLWLINMLVGGAILFGIAFSFANNDLETGNICKELKVGTNDCVGLGLTAAIYSIVWSVILSLIIKWKSSVNKKVPF